MNRIGILLEMQGAAGAAGPPPALAFDHGATGTAVSAATATATLTVGAGVTYGLVVAHVAWNDPPGFGSSLVGVTYNGVAMTQVPSSTQVVGACASGLFYLLAPATGTHDCVVTFTDVVNAVLNVQAYDGVNQATPFANTVTNATTSASPNINLTIRSGNGGYFAIAADAGSTSVTHTGSGNKTVRETNLAGSSPNRVRGSSGDDLVDTGSPFALSITQSASRPWAMIGIELVAA